ncbi:FIST N-terminal domain-containing protein [Petroclostridium sp. X23]|uniref:FIST signal transduction protein n=1 Tax=Petroclostridium sp. X23 TaxID=3045146 RepID=UPI0024AD0AEA|nr:FIST N-terminal domain-containing protein [Petroclostridium sp. X23]WHH57782.1 FIST N-terminal domain-containing protein [Petroclostridium sp. X23]
MNSLCFTSLKETSDYLNSNSDKGYVLHVPIDMIEELSKEISNNVILCSTSGEYTPSGYKNGVITGFFYESNEGEVVEILYPPVKSAATLEIAYKKLRNNRNAFMLLMCDGLSGMEESIMTTLYFMDKNFKIIGGSAGDNLQFQKTAIYIGSKKVHSAAIFFDIKCRTQILKENIYVPIGDKLLITDADPIKRIVKTINNNPASTEYARVLAISEKDLHQYFMNNPLGKIYEDDILIASPMKVNPDKSITFYCQVMPNTFIHILKPVDPIAKLNETLQALTFKPQFVYVVNCVLRSVKFQQEGIWNTFDRMLLDKCKNTTGYISYGEQFYRHHVNQTMVILAVE